MPIWNPAARCRTWLIGAAVQTRRLASVEPGEGPDLVDKIMASLARGVHPAASRWMRGCGRATGGGA